jgi:hypothetical protein
MKWVTFDISPILVNEVVDGVSRWLIDLAMYGAKEIVYLGLVEWLKC